MNDYYKPKIERNKKIVSLRKQGMKLRKIAKKYGVSHQRIQEILETSKDPDLPRRLTPEERVKNCVLCHKLFYKKNESNSQWEKRKSCSDLCRISKTSLVLTRKLKRQYKEVTL